MRLATAKPDLLRGGSTWTATAGLLLGAALLSWIAARGADPDDLTYFLARSELLLTRGWTDVYADPDLQVGPLLLLALALVGQIAGWTGVDALELLALVIHVAAAAGVFLVARPLLAGRDRPHLLAVSSALAAFALGLAHSAYADGHPAQLFVPLLWLAAGVRIRRGGAVAAGALVGASALLETWGLLGLVAFALAPGPRRAAASVATAGAVAVAGFLPFALAGSFRMLDYSWVVSEGTLVSLVLDSGSDFPWQLRLLQAAVAVGVGAAVARALRRTSHALPAALAATVATRLALDPTHFSWYWLGLQTIVLLGAVELLTSPALRQLLTRRERASGAFARPLR